MRRKQTEKINEIINETRIKQSLFFSLQMNLKKISKDWKLNNFLINSYKNKPSREKKPQSTLNLKFYCLDLLVGQSSQSKLTGAMLALITNIEQTDEPTLKKKKKKLHVVVALNFRVYQTLHKAGNLIHTVFSLLNQFNRDNAKIQQYHNANTHTPFSTQTKLLRIQWLIRSLSY